MELFTYDVEVDGTNIAGMTLTGATITYGATTTGQPPQPTVAFLELLTVDAFGDFAVDYPGISWNGGILSGFVDTYKDQYQGASSSLKVGKPVTIKISTTSGFVDTYIDDYSAGYDSTRFTGQIASLDYTPGLIGITAVDAAEALSRTTLDTSEWPAETETDRVDRILTAAGVTGQIYSTGSTMLRPGAHMDGKATPWQHLIRTAISCGSVAWVNRTGVVSYRSDPVVDDYYVAPPEATLVDPLKMSSEIGDVINTITVKYGDKLETTATNTASATAYGPRHASIQTELDSETDAAAFGASYVASEYPGRGEPAWHMQNSSLHLGLASDPNEVANLLDADIDDVMTLPYLLPASPTPNYSARIIGYQESLDPFDWVIQYVLDPYGWDQGASESLRSIT